MRSGIPESANSEGKIFPNLSISTTLRKLAAVLVAVIVIGTPAGAQNVNFELTDTGVLNDSSRGRGIEMRIQPNEIPEGG